MRQLRSSSATWAPMYFVPYNTYFRTPQESLSTVKWILRDLEAHKDRPAVVSHIVGDIGYAKGCAWLWDHFFEQIEPIAANTPYHTMSALGIMSMSALAANIYNEREGRPR